MASFIPGFEYDIFISYRQKDNKYDGWVTQFVDNLQKELEATFKEDIFIYFDENPHDGLLETHNVDKSLENKLKCLVFIPVISQTYCDPKSFAWQNEFCAFNKMAKKDAFGRDVRLSGGNVASRILPVKINDLDPEDMSLIENELGGVLRAVEFIYKEPGVNRPLTPDDDEKKNLNKTKYRNQINKVANAVKEIIKAIKDPGTGAYTVKTKIIKTEPGTPKPRWKKFVLPASIIIVLLIAGLLLLPKMIKNLSGGLSSYDKSVAVLPFDNLSNDPEQEYFSVGIVDEILDKLFKIGDLKVIARTSSARFKNSDLSIKEIARQLGVSAILEGSLQKMGNNIRITVQLIDARTEAHLWSEIYDKDISDIFLIQNEVAQTVARELKAVITPEAKRLIEKPPTSNLEAYNAYLKGRFYNNKLTEKDLETAMQYFEMAKEKDPDFALAYSGIGMVWACRQQMGIVKVSEAAPKTEAAITRALELDSTQSDVHSALAAMKVWTKWDWKGGEASYKKAIELNPNNALAHNAYSHLLNILGRPDEAMKQIAIALELDPLNPQIKAFYGIDLMFVHRYEDAIRAFQEALELSPGHGVAYGNIILALYFAGREDEAIERWRKDFKNPEALKVLDEGFKEGGFMGACKKLADFLVELSKTVYINPGGIAEQYALAGDIDNAMYWMEKDYEEHDPNLPYLLSPTNDNLRNDPRFQDLCRRMNLPVNIEVPAATGM
jgi:adenylate cyclase